MVVTLFGSTVVRTELNGRTAFKPTGTLLFLHPSKQMFYLTSLEKLCFKADLGTLGTLKRDFVSGMIGRNLELLWVSTVSSFMT